MNLPTERSWDRFWKTQSGAQVSKPSWSKQRMVARMAPYLRPGMRVLEAGCGGGFFSNHFISSGCSVTALDYSEDALELARKTTQGRCEAYLKDDLLDPKLGERHSGKFDLIFTDGLLEHFLLPQQKVIVGNLARSLAPGGVLVTFVPNSWSPWQWIRPFMMPGIEEHPFRPQPLKELHSGLSLCEAGGLNVLPVGVSPEFIGSQFGMLLYVIARKQAKA